MKKIFTPIVLVFFFSYSLFSQTGGIYVPQMNICDNLVQNFLSNYDIPGATFALAKDGKLVYMRSFGHANVAKTEVTQPYHLFRIASISKPITSIAIMKLLEKGQLSLTDKVFGPGSILQNDTYFNNATITDSRIYNITIAHLLEHSAGWNRNINCFPNPTTPYPWQFNGCDPIAAPLHVAQTLGESNPASERALIKFLLEKGLNFTPGTNYAYSNIGYLMLGEVIKAITGMEYEEYVKTTILEPLGICDMHLGKNLQSNKLEREGEYIGNGYTTLSSYGTGTYVPWEYGGFNVEAMGAHGGWIATAKDLVRLLVAVDGFSTKPDILSSSTLTTMSTPSSNNNYYSKGWAVNSANNWWHTGALDGTASFFARTSGGYNWAIILNKRVISNQANQFWSDFDQLPWTCLANTSSYPNHDFLEAPTTNCSNLAFSSANAANSLIINWNNGNGGKRLLVARKDAPVNDFPLDGVDYMASPQLGNGSNLGNNSYVIYNGTGNTMIVNNLEPNSTYHFRIFEFSQNISTGNYSLYMLCNSPSRGYFNDASCPSAINHSNVLVNPRNYQAENTIISEGIISGIVTYNAGKSVTLKTGFHAMAGSTFFASIEACEPAELFDEPILAEKRISSTLEDNTNPQQYLTIAPNPAHSIATITYELAGTSPVQLDLYTLTGQKVKTLLQHSLVDTGKQEASINLSNIDKGIYFIMLKTKVGVTTEKIVVY